MKIVNEREVVKIQININDVLCNKCGLSCLPNVGWIRQHTSNAERDSVGLIEITAYGSEYSTFLKDRHHYTFSLCEVCLEQLFESFMHPPEIENYSE